MNRVMEVGIPALCSASRTLGVLEQDLNHSAKVYHRPGIQYMPVDFMQTSKTW